MTTDIKNGLYIYVSIGHIYTSIYLTFITSKLRYGGVISLITLFR